MADYASVEDMYMYITIYIGSGLSFKEIYSLVKRFCYSQYSKPYSESWAENGRIKKTR